MEHSDVLVIGGGIVGLATALRLLERRPGRTLTLVEKEQGLALHQTGHNSGVVHSGIYYRPGSLKAKTCREGKRALEDFCEREGIALQRCGKVITAVSEPELPWLEELHRRGRANGVDCRMVGPEELAEIEPHAAGIRAVHVPETGITDFRQVADRMAAHIREAGGRIRLGLRVTGLSRDGEAMVVETRTSGGPAAPRDPERSAGGGQAFRAGRVVNCAGLYSDRLTRLSGTPPPARIVPFRGEYYELVPGAGHLVRGLLYPIPDPRFPFLGVHLTRTIEGGVECGPNAVLAFAREGYRKTDIHPAELWETLTYPGFLRLAVRHWRMGTREMWRSFSRTAFLRALQRLLPAITDEDLVPAPAGVRAQAVRRDGELVDDFLFEEGGKVLNVCNAPSPAATACLSIGDVIAERLEEGL